MKTAYRTIYEDGRVQSFWNERGECIGKVKESPAFTSDFEHETVSGVKWEKCVVMNVGRPARECIYRFHRLRQVTTVEVA